MKRFMVRRVLPVVLVFSLLTPFFCVSASAADFDPAYIDDDSVTAWEINIHNMFPEVVKEICEVVKCPVDPYDLFWTFFDGSIGTVGAVSFMDLHTACQRLQMAFSYEFRNNIIGQIYDFSDTLKSWSICLLFGIDVPNFVVEEHPSSGLMRIKDANSGLWVVDSHGRYPYYEENTDSEEPDEPAAPASGDHWVSANEVYKYLAAKNNPDVNGRDQLIYVCEALNNRLDSSATPKDYCALSAIPGSNYLGINKPGYFWCNSSGAPYVCWKDDKTATDQDRPVTEIVPEDGSEPIEPEDDFEVGIDFDGMVIYLPDGTVQVIDEIYYNPTTFTYDVTTYDFTDVDVTYHYTYEYYLQYTYVTYIGETSDFEAYKCYYELPDGRNSADLTKEELEQLSVAIDVVEYNRSTDDVRVRALYHFDGNTKDSSYWNHMSYFDWSNAPSITYMDVETFNGALYFDGNVRSTMHITLPTELGRGDFTIQFRYYQGQKVSDDAFTGLYLNADNGSNEWYPEKDDAVKLIGFDGSSFGIDETSKPEKYPVGSWFEMCITRQGDVFTYYLNGMPLIVDDDVFTGESFDDILTFHFDGGTVAYAMIDELRVLNYAIASGAASYYEPTAVPHDTNLALVLPEDKVGIADEYWSFDSSAENLMEHYGLADWTQMTYDPPVNLRAFNSKFGYQGGFWHTDPEFNLNNFFDGKVTAWYNSQVVETDLIRSGLSFDLIYDDETDYEYLSHTGGFAVNNAAVPIPFAGIYIPIGYAGSGCLADGDYVFSVVNGSGAIRSIKFTITNGVAASGSSATFGNLRISISRLTVDGKAVSYLFVGFNPKTDKVPTQPIVYMELIRGTSTDLKAEFHEDVAILDKDDQFKPTLAVRTDLEITDYQIGGVRPAIPSKGLVYALVQSGYITSLQIYNGQAWEAVDGRIWTGERWIPYSSYNIITLQDMYDISDTTNDYEYIYTETGFWSWWQRSWNEFTEKLFGLLGGGAGDVDLDEPVTESDPENEDDLSFWEFIKLLLNGCKAVFTGARQLFGGVVSTVPEAVSTLTGAFEPGGMAVSFLEGSDPDFSKPAILFQPQDVTVFPDGVVTFRIVARGNDLRYQWQYLAPGNAKWWDNSYKSDSMRIESPGAWRDGYQYRCVVIDRDGNRVYSEVVTLSVITTGEPKNIFYYTQDLSHTSVGVQVDYDAGANEFTLNGTTSSVGDIVLIPDLDLDWTPGEKYTLTVFQTGGSAQLAAGSGITYSYSIFPRTSSPYFRSGNLSLPEFPAKLSFTGTAFATDGSGYRVLLQSWRPGTTFDNYSFKIQLEKGLESTAYAAPFAAPVKFMLHRPDSDLMNYYETEVLDPWRYR